MKITGTKKGAEAPFHYNVAIAYLAKFFFSRIRADLPVRSRK
ncbi:MAG: hypothetical protein RLZZ211_1221 [Bacteroidota bacterium]|jgi:hypothetical protein